MNIVLAGMPGSGKTTVSNVLGKLLGAEVIDTDEEIVKNYGAITEIFDKFGEECFRNLETETVKKVCENDGVVISTGGGCLLRAENVQHFKNNGKIIFLRTMYETLLKRVEGDASRPLSKGGAKETMKALLAVRTPIYENAADCTVDTDGLSPEEVAAKIQEKLLESK